MSDIQTMPPPPGGDRNLGPNTLGAVVPITILSTLAVAARMYARIRVIRNVGWDDHTIVLAQLMNLMSVVFQIVMVSQGLGRHMYYIPLQSIVNIGLYFHITEILYVLSTATIKVSACLFLLRIMARGTGKTLRWFLYVLMGILVFLCVATAVVILVQCTPIAAGWDPRIKGRCWSYSQILGIGYAQNAWAIITDFVCAGFPIIILRKLQISNRNKYALWVIMSIGILSGICGIVKMVHLGDLAKGDFTYNGVQVNIWASLEENIGTIACTIPALKPLFRSLNIHATHGSNSKPTPNNNLALHTWKDSAANAFGSRGRTFHSIKNDTSSDSEEQILPVDDNKGIRKTTNVELFYHDAAGERKLIDQSSDKV